VRDDSLEPLRVTGSPDPRRRSPSCQNARRRTSFHAKPHSLAQRRPASPSRSGVPCSDATRLPASMSRLVTSFGGTTAIDQKPLGTISVPDAMDPVERRRAKAAFPAAGPVPGAARVVDRGRCGAHRTRCPCASWICPAHLTPVPRVPRSFRMLLPSFAPRANRKQGIWLYGRRAGFPPEGPSPLRNDLLSSLLSSSLPTSAAFFFLERTSGPPLHSPRTTGVQLES